MPNIKSAIRKVKRAKKQSEVNKFRKNRYKQALKKMQKLIEKRQKGNKQIFSNFSVRANEGCKNWRYKEKKIFQEKFQKFQKK